MSLLKIKNLKTHFFTSAGVIRAVDGVNLDINRGEIIGLVGESASGKSVTALSIMRLVPDPPGKIVSGEIIFNNENLIEKSEEEIRKIRGGEISMSFQDPMTFLNPVFNVSDQIAEAILLHQDETKSGALEKAIKAMELVGIPAPEKRALDYPLHFSGGMRQRLLIAIALACNPKLMIADEPTTALDVVTQAKILDLMRDLRKQIDSSILLITHDLGVVAQIADKVAIMYSGKIQEFSDAKKIFSNPRHPYTKGLLNSLPALGSTDRIIPIKGEPPDPIKPPSGCRYHPRCPYVRDICMKKEPEYTKIDKEHYVNCLRWEDIS
jgi:peptide/nickel transport system ATP-binding protein/oligopeptide transport system ATP-binding protein